MRKIGHVYTDAEIEAMDNKFIADMAEANAMSKPADTPYDNHYETSYINAMYALDNTMDEIVNAISRLMSAYSIACGYDKEYAIGKAIGKCLSITQMAMPYANSDNSDTFIAAVLHHAKLEYDAQMEMAMESRNCYD